MKRNVTPTGWAWIISISVVLFVGWLVWPSQTQAPDPVTAAPKAPAPAGVAAAPAEKQAEDAFAGLGATEAAFAAGHNTTAPAQPTPGIAVYQVNATNPAGRVIAYSVQITAKPPMGNRERMFLVEGDNLDLPDYPVLVRETSTCHVLKSATLKRLIGQPYARVTTTTGTDTAQIESVARPTC